MILLILLLLATPVYACIEDCTKVLVSNRVVKVELPEIPKPNPKSVKVEAKIESDDTVSAVKCEVTTDNDVDTITCGW